MDVNNLVMVPIGQFVPMIVDPGIYEGGYDEQGLRTGKGKCTWMDGTWYDGEWKNGQRNGEGEFSRFDGYWYKGGYLNDVCHGEGEEKDEAGNYSKTTWKNGEKHGRGIFRDTNGRERVVVWHHDLMIEEQAGKLEYCKDWLLLDVINCIVFWSTFFCFVAALGTMKYVGGAGAGVTGAIMAICFILNICSICKSQARQFASNIIPPEDTDDHIGAI